MTEHTHVGFSVGHRIMDMEGIRPMTDLRTRIAAVLGANSHMSRELQDHLADAVIEELGLLKVDAPQAYPFELLVGAYLNWRGNEADDE